MNDESQGKVVESLLGKLEEFGGTLDDDERAALVHLIGQSQPSQERRGVSAKELRQALDFLAASRLGRFDLARRKDDDGFWAQWAQRQS